jgi:hypothetical protein
LRQLGDGRGVTVNGEDANTLRSFGVRVKPFWDNDLDFLWVAWLDDEVPE